MTVQEHTEQNWLKVLTADARTLVSTQKLAPWMGCYSITGLPPGLNLPVPRYIQLGGEGHCKAHSNMSRPKAQHNNPNQAWTRTAWSKVWALTIRPKCPGLSQQVPCWMTEHLDPVSYQVTHQDYFSRGGKRVYVSNPGRSNSPIMWRAENSLLVKSKNKIHVNSWKTLLDLIKTT